MKIIKTVIFTIAAAAVLTACSSDKEPSAKKETVEQTVQNTPEAEVKQTDVKNEDRQTEDQSLDTKEQKEQQERNKWREEFLTLANCVVINDDSVTFSDANGKEMTVKKNPQKVYNLYASFTTLWYEAGGKACGIIGGDSSAETYKEYIGRDISKDEGMEILATSSSGSKWSVEKIIAGQPDLIICSTAMSGYKTISSPAEAAGIPVIAVNYDSFADYLKWYRVFTALLDREDLWENIGIKALEDVTDVLTEIPDGDQPSVFIMFSGSKELQANTSNTVVGGMARSMKAVNIADSWDNPDGAERLDINLETVFAADPDMILIQCHSDADDAKKKIAEQYGENPVWRSLRAVQQDKVHYLSKLLFHNKPNSRFVEAYRIMAELLYPETQFSFVK